MREETEIFKVAAYRADVRTALEWVATQMDLIEASATVDGVDEPMQRVVLSLPQSVVHLARFLAVMDSELMPASLRLWQLANSKAGRKPALQRNINAMMGRYLSDEITKQLFAEMNRLHAEAEYPRSQ